MADSDIEWTDKTWNCTRGCTIYSPGCQHCYAMLMAHRFSGQGQPYEGLTELGPNGPRWNGKIRLVPEKLEEPLHWKKPQKVFVDSMSDLFHKDVPFEYVDEAFAVMMLTPHHTYQILTKRADRMLEYLTDPELYIRILRAANQIRRDYPKLTSIGISNPTLIHPKWIIPGVSVENQEYANERISQAIIPLLKAGWRTMISCEPLLGPVDFRQVPGFNRKDIEDALRRLWVIVGGESGPGARPFEIDWARTIIYQCQNAGAKVFMKQVGRLPMLPNRGLVYNCVGSDWPEGTRFGNQTGEPIFNGRQIMLNDPKGGDPLEWAEDLRVREYLN